MSEDPTTFTYRGEEISRSIEIINHHESASHFLAALFPIIGPLACIKSSISGKNLSSRSQELEDLGLEAVKGNADRAFQAFFARRRPDETYFETSEKVERKGDLGPVEIISRYSIAVPGAPPDYRVDPKGFKEYMLKRIEEIEENRRRRKQQNE